MSFIDRQTIINELRNIIEELFKPQELELVDLIYRYEGRDLVLRILVDRPEDGVSLGECAKVNQDISKILDEKDILKEGYILEVSSPGLDRPLNSKADFLRCVNRRARFFLNEAINGRLELEAVISKVTETLVYVDIEGKTIEIALSNIRKAKQIF